jgi:hypothetical protein
VSKKAAEPTHDDRIKALLLQPRLLRDFFRAFIPEVFEFTDFEDMEYLDKEHPRTKRQPRRTGDVLVQVRWKDRPAAFLIHIESQGKPQETIVERAAEYALRDCIRYKMPVMPVVLLTYDKPEKKASKGFHWKFGRVAEVRVRCPVIHFRMESPKPHLAGKNVVGLALTALMKLSPDEQVDALVATVAEAVRQMLSPGEIEAALEFVMAYTALSEAQLLQVDDKVHKLSAQEPKLSPMPKLLNPFVELGKLKGRLEGRQEGFIEGREEGELFVILRQLKRKFPTLASKLAPKIKKLDEERLLSFGEALLFMQTPADCQAWLKKNG